MDVMTRLANSIVVPVVVLDKVEDAVPTAKAMAAGGVDTMEITQPSCNTPNALTTKSRIAHNTKHQRLHLFPFFIVILNTLSHQKS